MGERAIELMALRGMSRHAFGQPLARHGAFRADLARARLDLDAARLLVLDAALALDRCAFDSYFGEWVLALNPTADCIFVRFCWFFKFWGLAEGREGWDIAAV